MTPLQELNPSPLPLRIRYALGASSLGPLLIASTERGICAITFGAPPEELVADLRLRFPKAELTGSAADLDGWIAAVAAFAESPGRPWALPLDPVGTPFQQRVWTTLREIPPGTTVTYRELAHRVGQPKAVRAVARACATNAIALAIPCHRVVRTDGTLGGYRWGMPRKKALLERESAGKS